MSWEKEEAKSRHVDFQVSNRKLTGFLWKILQNAKICFSSVWSQSQWRILPRRLQTRPSTFPPQPLWMGSWWPPRSHSSCCCSSNNSRKTRPSLLWIKRRRHRGVPRSRFSNHSPTSFVPLARLLNLLMKRWSFLLFDLIIEKGVVGRKLWDQAAKLTLSRKTKELCFSA